MALPGAPDLERPLRVADGADEEPILAPGEEQQLALEADVLVTPLGLALAPFWAHADELSAQGLFVRTRQRLPADALLLLEVVFRDRSLPKLRLDAHVVHCIPGARFGCRFISVSAELTARLTQIIATAHGTGSR